MDLDRKLHGTRRLIRSLFVAKSFAIEKVCPLPNIALSKRLDSVDQHMIKHIFDKILVIAI